MDCKAPGKHFSKGKRVWPFIRHVEPKTKQLYQSIYDKIKANAKAAPLYGVKGDSILRSFNLCPSDGSPIDFMHNAYEGIISV